MPAGFKKETGAAKANEPQKSQPIKSAQVSLPQAGVSAKSVKSV
jgi:hypothetical protein